MNYNKPTSTTVCLNSKCQSKGLCLNQDWQTAALFYPSVSRHLGLQQNPARHATLPNTVETPILTADVAPGKSLAYKPLLSTGRLQKTYKISWDLKPRCISLSWGKQFAWVSSKSRIVSASLKPKHKHYRHKGTLHTIQESIRRKRARALSLFRRWGATGQAYFSWKRGEHRPQIQVITYRGKKRVNSTNSKTECMQ